MSFSTLLLEKRDGVATIRLNSPEVLNALNFEMGEDLAKAVVEVRDDEEVRSDILTGTGRSFCSGGDIKGMLSRLSNGAAGRREHLKAVQCWLVELINLEKPVIAAVNHIHVRDPKTSQPVANMDYFREIASAEGF